jgi:hypothetical protein
MYSILEISKQEGMNVKTNFTNARRVVIEAVANGYIVEATGRKGEFERHVAPDSARAISKAKAFIG